jgi:hypothetical protein
MKLPSNTSVFTVYQYSFKKQQHVLDQKGHYQDLYTNVKGSEFYCLLYI